MIVLAAQPMAGMDMPQPPPAAASQSSSTPPAGAVASNGGASMQGMDMSGASGAAQPSGSMPGMEMPDMAAPSPGAATAGQPAGDASPPPAPTDRYADKVFGAAAMSAARARFQAEAGGMRYSQVLLNIAEGQVGGEGSGFRWDGQGWFGGDIDRLFVKSEGSGDGATGLEEGEVQALYSRAITPYFDLQAGARETFGDSPARTWGVLGVEGLTPYWIDAEGALFVSTDGQVEGRLEGYYDQPITQRIFVQPRVELNVSTQDTAEQHVGAGLTDAELGVRLRYEIRREFAPYVGVSWERDVGRTAEYVRELRENPSAVALVFGIRSWF